MLARVLCSSALAVLSACATTTAAAPEPPTSTSDAAPPTAPAEMEFETYELVLLWTGDSADAIDPAALEDIQRAHLQHLQAMGDRGYMVLAGPLADQPDARLRGICIYRTGSVDAARELAQADPAVKAGRLRVEVMTWWVEKGYVAFPKAPPLQPLP